MQTLRYGHRKIHISKEAFVDEDFENDIDADPDGIDFTPKIYGLVFLDDVKLFHDMLQISACEKRMVRFWEQVSGQKLHGHSYIFSVKDFFAFRTPSLLQELGNSCYRSLMARLEAEQGPVLRCQLQEERDNCDCLAGRATPNVVLRLPLPYVTKVMAGEWHSIVLPHFPNTKHGGSAALAVNWKMWGIDQRELPQLPHYIEQELDEQDCEVSLSSEILDQAIDFLKAYAVTMEPLPGPNPGNADDLDDELLIRNSEYSSIRRCVSVLDSVLAGLDASAFARSARDMTGKGSGFWNGTRRPYQVAFLVKAVTLASLLRSASTMHEVLQSAARMLLPNVMHDAFQVFLDTCAKHIPHASTISRWKMILDGSFMLHQRRLNTLNREAISGGGFVRFLMADASTQHNREFEHIMLASIKKQDLKQLYFLRAQLLDQWFLHCMCQFFVFPYWISRSFIFEYAIFSIQFVPLQPVVMAMSHIQEPTQSNCVM